MHRLLLLSLFLTGCAAGVSPMTTPDGKKGFSVSCNGSANDWGTCYNAAAEACKGKYDILDRQTTTTPTAYGPMVHRYLVVGCAG
jgi:hypothetical protein